MPPKVKKEKLTDETIQQLCLEYLISQNRPYGAQDVAVNLHDKFTKAAALKALQALADRDEIECKDSGDPSKRSILIFCAKQDQMEVLDAESLTKLDEEIQANNEKLLELRSENQKLEGVVKSLFLEKSNDELIAREKQLDKELAALEACLAPLLAGKRRLYSAAEISRIEKEYVVIRAAHKKHMKEFEDMFAACCDNLDKSKSDALLWREELGIDEVEQDEENRWVDDPLATVCKRTRALV